VAIFGATGLASAQLEGDSTLGGSKVWSDNVTFKNCYPTSACGSATAYRFGDIIDCRRAETIEWCLTTSSTGSTTYVITGVQWLADNPDDPNPNGPYAGVYYYPGFELYEASAASTYTIAALDPWAFKELFMLQDAYGTTIPTTNLNATTATISLGLIWDTGVNHYRAYTTTKAPYCRPFVYYKVADTVTAWVGDVGLGAPQEGIVRINAILRYKPWPPYRQEEVSEAKGTWYGYPWVW